MAVFGEFLSKKTTSMDSRNVRNVKPNPRTTPVAPPYTNKISIVGAVDETVQSESVWNPILQCLQLALVTRLETAGDWCSRIP